MATLYEGGAAEQEYRLMALGGVEVVYLGQTTWADPELEDVESGDSPAVLGQEESVSVVTARLTGLRQGTAITVAGELREISEFRKRGPDGIYTRIFLRDRNPRNRAHRRG